MEANQKITKTTILDFGFFPPPRTRSVGAGNVPHYVGHIIVEYLDGKLWRVTEPFSYFPANGEERFIPAGFITDFATIPRFAWIIVGPPTGSGVGANYGPAAIVHDFDCRRDRVAGLVRPSLTTHKVMLEGMTVLRVDWWRRQVIYRSLLFYWHFATFRANDPIPAFGEGSGFLAQNRRPLGVSRSIPAFHRHPDQHGKGQNQKEQVETGH